MTEAPPIPDQEPSAEERMRRALETGVPRLYVNGFLSGLGISDIWCVLERNGKPEAMLNMSYTAAKSFAASLGQLVAILEERTGRDMLTTNDLERLLAPHETKQ
jgi:hypothetical protein